MADNPVTTNPNYALQNTDDFYRYFWLSMGESLDNYTYELAEQSYQAYLKTQIFLKYVDVDTDHQAYDLPEALATDYARQDSMSTDELTSLYLGMSSFVEHNNINTIIDSKSTGFIAAYYHSQERDSTSAMPSEDWANYDPNLMVNYYIHQQGGKDIFRDYLFDEIVVILYNAGADYWQARGGPPFDLSSHQAIRDALMAQYGDDVSLDDLMAYATSLSTDYEAWSTGEALETGAAHQTSMFESEAVQEHSAAYYSNMAYDQLRQIALDPSWNPEVEAANLQQLEAVVSQMTRSMMGIDIGWVQDGFKQYIASMREFHNWRKRLRAEWTPVDAETMAAMAETNSLWWLGETLLAMLFEPLDWLFTFRDLMQGDWGALIGLLPLVPGAIRNIGKAIRLSDKVADFTKFMAKLEKLDDSNISINQMSSSGRIEPTKVDYKVVKDNLPNDTLFLYPPEWSKLSADDQRMLRQNSTKYREWWKKTSERRRIDTLVGKLNETTPSSRGVTFAASKTQISYYGLSELQAIFNKTDLPKGKFIEAKHTADLAGQRFFVYKGHIAASDDVAGEVLSPATLSTEMSIHTHPKPTTNLLETRHFIPSEADYKALSFAGEHYAQIIVPAGARHVTFYWFNVVDGEKIYYYTFRPLEYVLEANILKK